MTLLNLNYNTSIFKLCFNTKTTGIVAGQRLREPFLFSSLPDMIFKLEYIMDMQNYPSAFQRKRHFKCDTKKYACVAYATSNDEVMSDEAVEACYGDFATLMLHILTRQNATWQGSVAIGDPPEYFAFESYLKLLEIIDKLSG